VQKEKEEEDSGKPYNLHTDSAELRPPRPTGYTCHWRKDKGCKTNTVCKTSLLAALCLVKAIEKPERKHLYV